MNASPEVTLSCPRPTTDVLKSCGQCYITGGTVDLLYYPLTATTSQDLCPTANRNATTCPLGPTTATNNATNPYNNHPCYYATGNNTSTVNSGPYAVSDGYTFYQNRAYISVHSVYAKDMCGYVGDQHEDTIVEVKSSDIYSIGGYHHEFADAGYEFNWQDLEQAPEDAYCKSAQESTTRYASFQCGLI